MYFSIRKILFPFNHLTGWLIAIIITLISGIGFCDDFVRTLGPGSFGNLFGIGIDPHDDDTVITTIDMGIAYRTENGGEIWSLTGGNSQENINPAYRGGLCVRFDPRGNQRVYIGGVHGLFRSDDGGRRWYLVQGGTPATPINDIAFNPANPDTLYITCGYGKRSGGWWKHAAGVSHDGGRTLKWMNNPVRNGETRESIAFSRIIQHGTMLYLCGPGGLFRSQDAGKSWLDLEGGIPYASAWRKSKGFSIASDIAVLPDGRLLVIRCPGRLGKIETGGFSVSADGGNTFSEWEKNFHIPPERGPHCKIEIATSNPAFMYLGCFNAVYGTRDGGKNWTFLSDHRVHWKNFREQDGVASEGRFPMLGGNFKESEVGIWSVNNLAISSKNPEVVYVAYGNGLLKSSDGGQHWEELFLRYGKKLPKNSTGMASPVPSPWTHMKTARGDSQLVVPNVIAFDPFRHGSFAAGFHDIGVHFTDDDGLNWRWGCKNVSGPDKYQIGAVSYDPSRAGRVYIGANRKTAGDTSRIFWSDDCGNTFFPLNIPALEKTAGASDRKWKIRINWILPDDDRLWVASSAGLFRREKENLGFLRVESLGSGDITRIFKVSDTLYYAAIRQALRPDRSGIFRSTDSGQTFVQLAPGQLGDAASLSICRTDPRVMVALCRRPGNYSSVWEPHLLYKSIDGGEQWRLISEERGGAAAIDPDDPNRIYLAIWAKDLKKERTGLLLSRDGGRHFESLAPDVPVAVEVREGSGFYFDPFNPARYFFSSGAGIYEFRKAEKK